jgi:hypothetical protein
MVMMAWWMVVPRYDSVVFFILRKIVEEISSGD